MQNIVSTVPLSFRGVILQNSSDPFFKYSEFINCNFIGNDAKLYVGIYTYDVFIRIANDLSITTTTTVVSTTVVANKTATNTTNTTSSPWWLNPRPKNTTTVNTTAV